MMNWIKTINFNFRLKKPKLNLTLKKVIYKIIFQDYNLSKYFNKNKLGF